MKAIENNLGCRTAQEWGAHASLLLQIPTKLQQEIRGQDLRYEFSFFFASNFRVCSWDLISPSCSTAKNLIFNVRSASLIKQFGFHRFLNQKQNKILKNWKKKKPLKHGNLETHLHFLGNLPAGSCKVKPREVNPWLDPLLIVAYTPIPDVPGFWNQRNRENQQKPETKLMYCWCWDYTLACRAPYSHPPLMICHPHLIHFWLADMSLSTTPIFTK